MQTSPAKFINIAYMKKAGYTVYMLLVLNIQGENLPDTVQKSGRSKC
jgi:hypothetical protein